MNTVVFSSCNLSSTKTNQVITAPFEYVGEGSAYGSEVRLLADVVAANNGYPNIKEGDIVYREGEVIFCQHVKNIDGYRVINRP